jgi:hypothetical protein
MLQAAITLLDEEGSLDVLLVFDPPCRHIVDRLQFHPHQVGPVSEQVGPASDVGPASGQNL